MTATTQASTTQTYTLFIAAEHDQLEHSPRAAAGVAGAGWMLVLSGLKTLLETGRPLGAA
jgi:hypothetical protein